MCYSWAMNSENSCKNIFYVYLHRKATNNDVFYVGKGKGKRAWWFHGRSEQWNRTEKKHGVVVEIFSDCLSEQDAHSLEMELIKSIGRSNLCNHTDGGEGMSGWHASEETRLKQSILRKGRKMSEEFREAVSIRFNGVKKTEEHNFKVSESLKGRVFSEEHRKNLSEAIKKRKFNPEWGRKSGESRSKKVLCINTGDVFASSKAAQESLGLCKGSVSRVCNGKQAHTHGYIFKYLEDEKQS